MRVALHHPDGSVAAFRLGRIVPQVNHVTGETTDVQEIVEALVPQAREEHPDCEVVVERFVDNGDDTGTWVAADKEETA